MTAGGSNGKDPKAYYRVHVFCCTNERPAGHPRGCCKEKGSEKLRNYMKARAKEEGLDDVLITHVKNGGRVSRLMLKPEDGPDHK
jgi:hypothetical protein